MSERPAACIALILPGSCGAGALVYVMFETRFGYFALNASKPFCVSWRSPATSTMFSVTASAACAAGTCAATAATATAHAASSLTDNLPEK
ncbi:conserved hypothetical protein, partial [Ricinus communis]